MYIFIFKLNYPFLVYFLFLKLCTYTFYFIYKELTSMDINNQSTISSDDSIPKQTESIIINDLNNDPSTISTVSTLESSSSSASTASPSTSSCTS